MNALIGFLIALAVGLTGIGGRQLHGAGARPDRGFTGGATGL
jgi:hypothetical protein